MARSQCPFPEKFRVVCRVSRYRLGLGYVDDWLECEAVKDNGWYRFYEVRRNAAGHEWHGGEYYRPKRWKELQVALERGIDIRMAELPTEDEIVPDLSDLI